MFAGVPTHSYPGRTKQALLEPRAAEVTSPTADTPAPTVKKSVRLAPLPDAPVLEPGVSSGSGSDGERVAPLARSQFRLVDSLVVDRFRVEKKYDIQDTLGDGNFAVVKVCMCVCVCVCVCVMCLYVCMYVYVFVCVLPYPSTRPLLQLSVPTLTPSHRTCSSVHPDSASNHLWTA